MNPIQKELAFVRLAIEKIGRGLIVLTRGWRVVLISGQAQRWLTEYFGQPVAEKKCLPQGVKEWIEVQEAYLPVKNGASMPYKTLASRKGGERLLARLVSDQEQHILILNEQLPSFPTNALDRFGVTNREGEVLSWVAQGKTNEQIGAILSISPRTVGKHLERIYEKLGVETRTSAATFILTSTPPVITWTDSRGQGTMADAQHGSRRRQVQTVQGLLLEETLHRQLSLLKAGVVRHPFANA